jgi:hypothetical protein
MAGGIDKAITAAFAPQITPIYMFALLLAPNLQANLAALTVAIVFASAIPLASLLAYVKLAKVDYQIMDPRKRYPLFIIAVVSYAVGLVLLLSLRAPFIASALMLCYAINTAAAGLINRFDKISTHVWGISGPAVALFYAYGCVVFAVAIALAVLVGVSRIRMKAHTAWQVASAMLVSVPLTLCIVYLIAPFLFSL